MTTEMNTRKELNEKELNENELNAVNGGCRHEGKENHKKKGSFKFTPVDPKERDLPWKANRYN